MTSFAFNPDGGPARVLRYIEHGTLSSSHDEHVVAVYDREQNVLVIDRRLYDTLSEIDQHRVLRTHAPQVFITYDPLPRIVEAEWPPIPLPRRVIAAE